jgi:hypothetical protein
VFFVPAVYCHAYKVNRDKTQYVEKDTSI